MAQKTTQPKLTNVEPPVENEPRSSTSLFSMARTAQGTATFPSKMEFMGDIRQRLAQVADEAKAHGEHGKETEVLADQSATRLYQARIAGMITQEELNGLLGDVFGYKPKQDGTPGKTPAGSGEVIRKRIVRAVQGREFVNGGDGGRFFESMDAADVAPIINGIGRTKKVMEGDKEVVVADGPSVWSAYKLLGDIKSKVTVRLPFAFDPKKILGLVESLSEAGAREKLLSNPSLLRSYGALFDQLGILNSVDASEVETVRAALGITEPEETETEEEGGEQVAA